LGEGYGISCSLTQHPAYSIEVLGLDAEAPASSVRDLIAIDGLVDPIAIYRSAIMKFMRHKQVKSRNH
jgi:hypothetical protein